MPTEGPRLEGIALATFGLCVAIILGRGAALAAYVMTVNDLPGVKVDTSSVATGVVVLCFYAWSAFGIFTRDPRGYRRLRNMSLVFGILQLVYIGYAYTKLDMAMVHSLAPSLWALIVPVPAALVALHLVAAFVSHRAMKVLVAADEHAFR